MPFSIKETKDYQMIKEMLTKDDELFDRISDDHTNIDSWEPERSLWLGWFEDGICKALLEVVSESTIVLSIHINIPQKNRGEKSFEMGNSLLKYLIKNCNKNIVKLNAKIPIIYPDVIRFAEKNGFKREGTDSQSHIKNGKLYDRAMMGRSI